jgi:stage III sporulation protein AA
MKTMFPGQTDDLSLLISKLPKHIQEYIRSLDEPGNLIEIVMDLGRKAEVRFPDGKVVLDSMSEITQHDIDAVIDSIGQFNDDNRAGIERTLHRISGIRNRTGKIIGLTMRVGRAVEGTIEVIRDVIEGGRNILFLGPPGIGKTTKLREAARVLADEFERRVVVVDTSNEIAGDGDIPHRGIGSARRMQVPNSNLQHATMIEAVENHMPEVIIVDEIGTEAEASAARTIAERGVQLIATAHGFNLENIIKNPTLCDLIGGIQSVVLGDEEAKFRGTQKTVSERRTMPTFDVLIEIKDRDVFDIHHDIAESVDAYLEKSSLKPENRDISYMATPQQGEASEKNAKIEVKEAIRMEREVGVFPYGINQELLTSAIKVLDVPAAVAGSISDADMILTIKSQMKSKGSKIQQLIQGRQIPLHVLKNNSSASVKKFFKEYFKIVDESDSVEKEAIEEARRAIERVKNEKRIVDLAPKTSFIRRLQHQAVAELGYSSLSIGKEPNRRLRIYPRDIN